MDWFFSYEVSMWHENKDLGKVVEVSQLTSNPPVNAVVGKICGRSLCYLKKRHSKAVLAV